MLGQCLHAVVEQNNVSVLEEGKALDELPYDDGSVRLQPGFGLFFQVCKGRCGRLLDALAAVEQLNRQPERLVAIEELAGLVAVTAPPCVGARCAGPVVDLEQTRGNGLQEIRIPRLLAGNSGHQRRHGPRCRSAEPQIRNVVTAITSLKSAVSYSHRTGKGMTPLPAN